MSRSARGNQQRRRSTVTTNKAANRTTPDTQTPTAKGKNRPPVRPGKTSPGWKPHTRAPRAWGPIALISAVALIAVVILGYGGWAVYTGSRSWQDRAAGIEGLLNFRDTDPKLLEYKEHTPGPLTYRVNPAVGGTHNIDWQNCMGDIYPEPIAQEHAVHSLEHGAVWITYRPDLPKDQVDKLARKVRGKEKMLMSPYRDLDSPISLQAWGYRLKVPNADDSRVDEFIKVMRVNASREGPNANCSQGITATGDKPIDRPQAQQQR